MTIYMTMVRRVRHRAVTTRGGWHPLVDEWAGRIVADADLRPGELVVVIGVSTMALAAAVSLDQGGIAQGPGSPLRHAGQRVFGPFHGEAEGLFQQLVEATDQ